MKLYELALMGSPTASQQTDVKKVIEDIVKQFGLSIGAEIGWSVNPTNFSPPQDVPAAVAFFGSPGVSDAGLQEVLIRGIPVIPIVSVSTNFSAEIPASLRSFNGLSYSEDKPERIGTALLECAGLLPRQRRVFVSYRRTEAKDIALQLFGALSARLYNVFLDTHGIAPAEEFQNKLWRNLCDSDVIVMLDTKEYFDSRWTSAEYARALSKQISILRIGWPQVTVRKMTSIATDIQLDQANFDASTNLFTEITIDRICEELEKVRSRSHAVRWLNAVSEIKVQVERVEGEFLGIGFNNSLHLKPPNGHEIVAYPVLGVPTSQILHDAVDNAKNRPAAIIYDPIGLDQSCLRHLTWLGTQIQTAKWIDINKTAWTFADWEEQ